MVTMLKLQDPKKDYEVCHTSSLSKGVFIDCTCDKQTNHCNVVTIAMAGLDLSGGVLPEVLQNFTQLKKLDLSGNQINGPIPESLGNLSKLEILDLSLNNLQGPIPQSLGRLSSLWYLSLSRNQLNGSIPESLGNLKNLQQLYLYKNLLSGSIPESFKDLKVLNLMYIHVNQLSGNLPDFLDQMQKLQYLDLGNNRFNGPLPPSIGTMKQLRYLKLPANNLVGGIPENYDQLNKLYKFSVAGNNLIGTIPSFIKDWTEINQLELMGNNFEGPLPLEIFTLSRLYILWVSDLIITSSSKTFEFPESANFNSTIESLILRNCSIGGRIPEYIGNMSDLDYLDLSLNKLSGGIPDSLQNLYDISMSFAGNKLTGSIPEWATNDSSRIVDLSDNDFLMSTTLEPQIRHDMSVSGPPEKIEAYCPPTQSKDDTLFINCGGNEKFEQYEVDNVTSKAFVSAEGKWGYSCAGNFMATTASGSSIFGNSSGYLKNTKCAASPLYETARLCPVSLTYYGFCLRSGTYDVQLHFSEIVFSEETDYSILKERVFDIYVQNMSRRINFNIKTEAGGPNKPWVEFINKVPVHDDLLLKIQLLWAGKGAVNDNPLLNGPLISAISVKPAPKSDLPLKISLGAGAFIILLYSLIVAVSWKMGWLGNKEWQKTSIKLRGEVYVTVKQIIDATQNFSKNEIGRGGYGIVYRVELCGQILAVKKLFRPTNNIVMNREAKKKPTEPSDVEMDKVKNKHGEEPSEVENILRNESFTLQSLEHDNLIKYFGSFSRKDLHLLVYEYMENGSLHSALFGSKSGTNLNWKTRVAICMGIAKGLKYLHEEKGFIIVHRDIKTSNILLDAELIAKISDFGLATIYDKTNYIDRNKHGGDQYTAPEYVRSQIFSDKTDIYSFGILLLEIVSGKRHTIETRAGISEFLHDTACKYRKANKLLDLVDKRVKGDEYNRDEADRILNLAMMCTESSAELRPPISEVVSILNGEKPVKMNLCPKCGGTGKLSKTSSSTSEPGTEEIVFGDNDEKRGADDGISDTP